MAAMIDPLLFQVVIVQPLVLQFLFPFALSQSVAPVIPPGANVRVAATTALDAKAVLLVVLESPGFESARLNVTVVPPARGEGTTEI